MTSADTILASKYPAKAHARRVAQSIKARHGGAGAIYLEAQKTRLIEDNDEAQPFRCACLAAHANITIHQALIIMMEPIDNAVHSSI